MQHLFLAKI